MEANSPLIKSKQIKGLQNDFGWFFSCSLNKKIFRFSAEAVHLMVLLNTEQIKQILLGEKQLKRQLQRVSLPGVNVQKYRIIRVFQDEDYIYLIIQVNGTQYLAFIHPPQIITQMQKVFLQLKPFKSIQALKTVLKLKIMGYKVCCFRQNSKRIILVCNCIQTEKIIVYQLELDQFVQIKQLIYLKETIVNCYFKSKGNDFIVSTGLKLLYFQYQQRDSQSLWVTHPLQLQSQIPLDLYYSGINLILIESNETNSQKLKGVNVIFKKIKLQQKNPRKEEQLNAKTKPQFIDLSKMFVRLDAKQTKLKLIEESSNNIVCALYNKEQLYIIQKDKSDESFYTKVQVQKSILNVQFVHHSLIVFHDKSYFQIKLNQSIEELRERKGSKVAQAQSSGTASLSYSSSSSPIQRNLQRSMQRSMEIQNAHKGKPSPSNVKIQKSAESKQSNISIFNTKKQQIKQQLKPLEQEILPEAGLKSVQNKISQIVIPNTPRNKIEYPPITVIHSQDQNSDNDQNTPSLQSSDRSMNIKEVNKRGSIQGSPSPITKLNDKSLQNSNLVSFGIQERIKANQEKETSTTNFNNFSFNPDQVRNLNSQQPKSFTRQQLVKLERINQKLNKFRQYLLKMNKNILQNFINFNIEARKSTIQKGLDKLPRQIEQQCQKLIYLKSSKQQKKLTSEEKEQRIKDYQEIVFRIYSTLVPHSRPKNKIIIGQKDRKVKKTQDKLFQKLKEINISVSSLKQEFKELFKHLKQQCIQKKEQKIMNEYKQRRKFTQDQEEIIAKRIKAIFLLKRDFSAKGKFCSQVAKGAICKLDQF